MYPKHFAAILFDRLSEREAFLREDYAIGHSNDSYSPLSPVDRPEKVDRGSPAETR
jgi:hypothetical protein